MKATALNKEIVAVLRKYAAKAEQRGGLQHQQLRIIYDHKWFKLFVPESYGGLQMSLPEALELEEQLAYIDGSLGWTVTLCAGANLFSGFIEKSIAAKIFSSKKVCFGGSGAVGGIAKETENGYIVNGHWKYATGAPHLSHFTANCKIEKKGTILLSEKGIPVIRSFFFNKKDVTIYEDWNAMGLKATAGHSFSVKDLKVKREQSFEIEAKTATHQEPVYQYPFLQFAEATIAVNTLGMTFHFLKEAIAIVEERFQQQKSTKQQFAIATRALSKAQIKIGDLKNVFYSAVHESWNELLLDGRVSQKRLKKISVASRRMVWACRSHIAAIYPFLGLSNNPENASVNSVFRDIFTASQHGLLTI